MKLKVLQLDFQWPEDVPLGELRLWLVNELTAYGNPLRWSITSIDTSDTDHLVRQLKVEAVVIIP